MAVGYGNHLDRALVFTVDDCEWKPTQSEFPGPLFANRPASGRIGHQVYGPIQFLSKAATIRLRSQYQLRAA